MNRKQRQALFFLILNLTCWSILAFSGLVLYLSGIMSTVYIIACAGCVLWSSFMWLIPISKRLRSRSKALMDERDITISKQCAFAGYISIWLFFIVIGIVLWFTDGPDGTVPIGAFPVLLYLGMGVFAVVTNIASLILYKNDTDAIEGGAA
ncbi:MAG: hypothetical protein ACYTEU_04850 [Planctomycetota bacterium]